MKRLLIALVAAVAVSTAFARVTDKQSFESSFDDFEPSVADEDSSALAAYNNDKPTYVTPPYDFANYEYGSRYLSLDTGDATLWRTNSGDAAYLDMVMQLNPCSAAPEIDEDTKIAVYVGSDEQGNPQLFVLSGDGNGNVVTNMAGVSYNTSNWIRLTIASNNGMFYLYANGVAEPCGPYYPLPGKDATIKSVGFKGTGKLDDFVARTTNPFFDNENAVVSIDGLTGERYASLEDAIADNPTATPQLEANTSLATPLAYGKSISVKLNNHTLSGITTGSLVPVASTSSAGVTTYTANYFPRTATAGQAGTAANPYEIADVDDLQALKAAFAADATFRAKNYKLVNNIDATGLDYWDGIGTASGTNGDSGLNGGTFDGAGYTISNVKFSNAKYRGFFNQVLNSTIKDLTINVVDIAQLANSSAEHGYSAFAGNIKNSKIQNCVATGTIGTTAKPAMHTCGGFAVKSAGGNVFENCTNYVDIVCSLTDNPKIGGIVGLVQEGTAALTNCWNYGDITITCKTCDNDGNGAGGLIGYGTTAITIYGGGNAGTIQSTDTTSATGTKPIKVGTIIAMQNASSATVSGGTVAQADAAPAGAFANVFGLTYAMVDNNVATFVPDADLAAGNTYTLLADVAASETPVFTLTSASDTIAFDTAKGFTFAGTVAVDRSKLMPATSATVGTVTTYSTTAGVASVDDLAYATFQEALTAINDGETTQDYVTLLTDVTYVISAGTTVRVKTGTHTFTPVVAENVILASDPGEDDVLTLTAIEGTATPDYSPWAYASGIVVWRATSGQLFHQSTVADVDAESGEISDTYAFGTSGHPWQVFASNQTQYRSPGAVLVFDEAGYNNNSDAQFAPLSFGGMWVKALQAENTPYCITDNKTDGTSDRKVELGATNESTYFKFDESFTFNRNTATAVKGTATVEIADGKTFTINARPNAGAVVEAGSTLILKGAGTLAVVSGLSVYGTLDLSEVTRPTISGDVALAGTIVLPAETEVSPVSPFTVCSGTLSGANVYVKIGDSEAVEKSFTAENGAITSFGEPSYVFYENYPTIVPAGKTYTFVGGNTADATVELDARDVRGTLKTQGYFSFTNYKSDSASTLDVESGSLTLHPGNNWFNGTLTVESGATFVNGKTDAVQYGGSFTANIYGTLAMGDTRWSLGSNNTLNFHEGCTVTGSGQGGNGTFDWIENATGTLNVDGNVSLAAPIRIRSTATVNINVDTTDQKGVTLAGTIGAGKIVKKGAGLVKFTTNPPYAIAVESGAFTFAVDATPTITYSAKPGTGTTMSMWYATQDTWKGTVVIGDLNAPAALPLNAYGNANSKIVLTGTTGNCYLNGTTTVAAELVVGTNGNNVVEFNNGSSDQVGTFTKVSGPGTLKLVGWTGCRAATYVLSTLDNFEGLAVANNITRDGGGTFTIRIGNIVTTRTTNPGDCVLPIANTAVENATGTVVYDLANATVNGNTLVLEAKDDGIYVAAAPTAVTITVPAVANTTVTVVASEGDVVNNGDGTYTVSDGATVTVTYSSDDYEVTGGTIEFTAIEGYVVDTTAVVTKQYVAYVVFQQESGQSFVDVTNKYTTVATAIDAAKAMKKTIVLIAQPEATDTYEIQVGETINVKKGEFAFDGIIFPEGPQYNNTTTETAGVTQYKCAVYTATVQYPGEDPQGVTTPLAMILNGLYTGYAPSLVGTVVTVLDGSDATVGDAMPDVFTYDSLAHTYTLKTMVASYNNGYVTTYYPTLAYAVENVISEGTIMLLADVTLTARVEPNKSMTIDLGGYTLSRTGTGGNGSVFDVKSGNVVITNGVIDCTQDDADIVADGVYAITARSGANVTLGGLTITVNSECGACVYPFSGATVTILSGTYANTTSTPYRYKQAWTGMAVNQANVSTQLITIYGGSFKQVDPTLGDDSWASAGNGFLASGYAATWNPSTGYYDVAEYVPPSGIDPESGTEIAVDTTKTPEEQAADAQAAAAAMDVQKTADADAKGVDQTTWNSYFTKTAEKVNDVWVAKAELNPAVVLPVDGAEETPLTDMLESVATAAVDATGETKASVPTKAGLFYWIEGATDVGAASYTPGTAVLGDGNAQPLERPTLTGENGKAFFKVCVGVAAPVKD